MDNSEIDVEALVDCMAQASGISIEPEYRQAVLDAMTAYCQGALLLLDFPLADEIEPASVYVP
jgi:hypothetical protein